MTLQLLLLFLVSYSIHYFYVLFIYRESGCGRYCCRCLLHRTSTACPSISPLARPLAPRPAPRDRPTPIGRQHQHTMQSALASGAGLLAARRQRRQMTERGSPAVDKALCPMKGRLCSLSGTARPDTALCLHSSPCAAVYHDDRLRRGRSVGRPHGQ